MAVVDADLNIARGIRRIVRTVALHVLRDNYRNSCVGVLKTMAKPNQQKNEYARDGYRSAQSQIAQCRCHYSHNRIRRAGDLSPFKSSLWPMLATILIRPCCKGQAAPRALRCASPQFVMNDGENGVTLRQIIVCAARCRFVQILPARRGKKQTQRSADVGTTSSRLGKQIPSALRLRDSSMRADSEVRKDSWNIPVASFEAATRTPAPAFPSQVH
jgi:hypothetical protein